MKTWGLFGPPAETLGASLPSTSEVASVHVGIVLAEVSRLERTMRYW